MKRRLTQNEISWFLPWISAPGNEREKARVRRILELVYELQQAAADNDAALRAYRSRMSGQPKDLEAHSDRDMSDWFAAQSHDMQAWRRLQSAERAVAKAISKYRHVSTLQYAEPGLRMSTFPVPTPVPEEGAAIYVILSSAEHGLIRKCEVCNGWIFAGRKDQVTCSTRCRQRRYESTEQYRERRRRYMKDYYRHPVAGASGAKRRGKKKGTHHAR